MSARIFLDTNTLVYLLEGKVPAAGITLTQAELEANRKGDITLGLFEHEGLFVGVQVLSELCNVVLRRKFDWSKTKELLRMLEVLCMEVVPLTLAVHKCGIGIRDKYKLQFFDSMMLAAALEAGCDTFYSEDMQDGQVIEQTMTIKNPFKA